jgi:hypothetical protein
MCGPGKNVGVTENRERGTGKMVWNYKEKYNTDPEFKKKERLRQKIYNDSEHGKAVKLAHNIFYGNSEHGFITNSIAAAFKPSSCRKRGLWPAITKAEIWKELEKHRSDMKNKYPESDGNLCIYCENPWTYKRTVGTGKRVKHTTNFSIDRIDNNKTYQVGNLGFCCSGCNDKKHHATLELMENVIRVAKEKGLR